MPGVGMIKPFRTGPLASRLGMTVAASLVVSGFAFIAAAFDMLLVQRATAGAASFLGLGIVCAWCIASLALTVLLAAGRAELVARISLVIASTAIMYLALDVAAGLFLIPRLSPRIVADPYRHHKLLPNSHADFDHSEYRYVQRVNNLGLRGPDVSLAGDSAAYRILLLGDSFTMGKGVADGRTFAALLQSALNREAPVPIAGTVETLNAGTDSYAPVLSLLQLRELGPLLQPDLVVLNFDMSDLLQETAYRRKAVFGPNDSIAAVPGEPRAQKKPVSRLRSLRHWIDQHLFLTRMLLVYFDKLTREPDVYTVRNTVTLANPDLLKHTLQCDTADRSAQWGKVFDSIRSMKRFCDENGMAFLLTTYPWGHQVGDAEWAEGRRHFIPRDAAVSDRTIEEIASFAQNDSIRFLNAFPAFRSYAGGRRLYYDYDPHWTPAGHELMAGELARSILENFLRADAG
ncbi:MAG: hypothetical protein GF418_00320 [Chitinivibrionales bacterium]|nr:hypothetical protein [Chitinivibrionales bacterium]MBD3394044.1 hypothetical protein [Chitinivibrionales bacterium]